MGILDKMRKPIFLKESNQAEVQLSKLRELEPLLNSEGQAIIRQDIKLLEYGIAGEKNIAFELKNSHMPLYILHDVYLQDGDLTAQIDYLVFTRKMCFVIECKNLYGNIEINSTGDFIRTIEFGRTKRKEGIYSPITQNQRHLDLMKRIKINRVKNIVVKFIGERFFDASHKSIIVLSNPKTILNTQFAKKEDKDKVIRADQLVNYIKTTYSASKEEPSSDSQLLKWAESYLALHQEVEKDYTAKYKPYLSEMQDQQENISNQAPVHIDIKPLDTPPVDITQTDIFQALKQYRLLKSREEKIKPYFIYNNNQLENLILKKPTTLQELQRLHGFGDVKVNKYGPDILQIIKTYMG